MSEHQPMVEQSYHRMRLVSERVDLALNAEKDDSFMEFKPSDIQLFIDALRDSRVSIRGMAATVRTMATLMENKDEQMHDLKTFVRSAVLYFEEGRSPLGTPWFEGLKRIIKDDLQKA